MMRARGGSDAPLPERIHETLVTEFARTRRVSRAVIEEWFTNAETLWAAVSALASRMVDTALALRRDRRTTLKQAHAMIAHAWQRHLRPRRMSEELADITNWLAFLEENSRLPQRRRRTQ